jgi:predicted DsbA family dithiol-disulfide isomerase
VLVTAAREDRAAEAVLTVIEYTDPACPWAWGSEPKFQWLRGVLDCPSSASAGAVLWRRVFGILFDEGEAPAPDPAAEAAWYLEELAEISGHTGAPYPDRLGWVTATSWPASLAAKAAERQGPQSADAVLRRLRETTFLAGEPADTPQRVLAAVHGLPGLDIEMLATDAAGPEVREAVRRDWAETRAPCPEVFAIDEAGRHTGRAKPLGEDPSDGYRYALPTLLFIGAGGRFAVAGWRPEDQYLDAVRRAAPALSGLCDTAAAQPRSAG